MLTDKVAIVTGAGRGLGAAIAKTLAAAGARVAANDINPDRAERIAGEIRAAGGQAIGIHADVANKFQCVHLIETTRAEWGRVDILVNNAAVEPTASIIKMDEWDWNRCLDVNLKGTFFMSQLCGRVMADQNTDRDQNAGRDQNTTQDRKRGGVIVNISSVAGVAVPFAGRAAFCASKAAVVGFARECAREYAQYGIRVNTVVPGLFDTTTTEMGHEAAELTRRQEEIPMQRLGRPQEAANVVLFLCSDDSSYMTGSTVTVDGGWVMR